jgi:hypothetical protein
MTLVAPTKSSAALVETMVIINESVDLKNIDVKTEKRQCQDN